MRQVPGQPHRLERLRGLRRAGLGLPAVARRGHRLRLPSGAAGQRGRRGGGHLQLLRRRHR
eukprot:6134692-Alexandrium_andersonii.AAC.1